MMVGCNGTAMLSGGLVCFVYFVMILVTSHAQDTSTLDEQNGWPAHETDSYLEDKRRLSKGLKFGRRAMGRLQFGKRPDENEVIKEVAEEDSDDRGKRYYTDMLDNLYLEDLLQSLNVDRYSKRAKMTFGKRAPSWSGKRMRLTFGKRDDELIEDEFQGPHQLIGNELEDDKRARMTFGKRGPGDKRARMTFGKREPGDKRARMTFGKREPDDKRARMTFGKRESDNKRARMTFGKRESDNKRARMTFGKRDSQVNNE